MELNQLRQFKSVAELGSISEAAEKLFISQPALSQAIKRLEGDLGISLFDRVGKRIVLNSNGEAFLSEVTEILEKIDNLYIWAHKRKPSVSPIIIGSVSYFLVAPLTKALNETFSYPFIIQRTYYSEDKLEKYLLNGTIDVAITSHAFDTTLFENIQFGGDMHYACLPSNDPLLEKKVLTIDDLNNRIIVRPKMSTYMTDIIEKIIQERSLNIKIVTAQTYLDYLMMNRESSDTVILPTGQEIFINKFPDYKIRPLNEPDLRYMFYFSLRKKRQEKTLPFVNWFHENYNAIYKQYPHKKKIDLLQKN